MVQRYPSPDWEIYYTAPVSTCMLVQSVQFLRDAHPKFAESVCWDQCWNTATKIVNSRLNFTMTDLNGEFQIMGEYDGHIHRKSTDDNENWYRRWSHANIESLFIW